MHAEKLRKQQQELEQAKIDLVGFIVVDMSPLKFLLIKKQVTTCFLNLGGIYFFFGNLEWKTC